MTKLIVQNTKDITDITSIYSLFNIFTLKIYVLEVAKWHIYKAD